VQVEFPQRGLSVRAPDDLFPRFLDPVKRQFDGIHFREALDVVAMEISMHRPLSGSRVTAFASAAKTWALPRSAWPKREAVFGAGRGMRVVVMRRWPCTLL